MLSFVSSDSTEPLSSIDSTNSVEYDKLQKVRNAKNISFTPFQFIILYTLLDVAECNDLVYEAFNSQMHFKDASVLNPMQCNNNDFNLGTC